jgi:shikimate kinase
MGVLWLIGMMGSGKSRVGRTVAHRLAMPFVDTDAEVSRLTGCTIPELFEAVGEERFRDVEEGVVRSVATAPGVVATGGGVVLRPANVAVMRASGTVVWLRAGVDTLAGRVRQGRGRPLLEGVTPVRARLEQLMQQRTELYAGAATHVLDTDGWEIEDVADEVVGLWQRS